MDNKVRKSLLVAGLALILVLIGTQARASFLGDVWNSIKKPFTEETLENKENNIVKAQAEVPLYKPALDYEQAVIAAVKKASPAVVSITVSKNVPILENCNFGPFSNLPRDFQQFFGEGFFEFDQSCEQGTELREVGGGSGFFVSTDGLVVTNRHVVSDKQAAYTVFTNDGKKYSATVVALDPAQDLAVLKVNGSGFSVVVLGDSDSIELGQSTIAIGNALGEFRNTVSVGVISGLSRDITASSGGVDEQISGVIQTDAAINPGNSGGPLLNLKGEVIGINTAIVSGAQNIGFAIPVNKAKSDIQSVKTTGEIRIPYLGVRYLKVTAELAKQEKLAVDYGVLIQGGQGEPAIISDSPAQKAGLLVGDIIIEVNGQKLQGDLGSIISELKVGQTVNLKINRQGKVINLNVTLGKRPTE